MPALWAYPWTLHREGLEAVCDDLTARGIDALTVASHYHSVRSMQPRSPDDLFQSFPGGCYFDPDDRFDDCAIDPPVNAVGDWTDPLAAIVDTAHDHGLAVNGWTVCMHNSRLGAENPEYRIESAFGEAHDHSLCPSHPAVRDYFAAVVSAIRDHGVDEIQLESAGFPSAFHDHGPQFGHDKRQTVTTAEEELLLSQCFCDGCRSAAESHPVDFDRARVRVRELIRPSLDDPTASPPLTDRLESDPVVSDLLDFRGAVVKSLFERLATAAGSTPLNYYAMEATGFEPSSLSASGVRLGALERHLDRVTALCYVSDPEAARDRVSALRKTVDLPVDVGLTLDPEVVGSRVQLGALVDAVRSATDGRLSIYHHTLATKTQLSWVDAAID